ncbi:M48 family metalloprotease, partial [Gordonia sp. (in: high G+C Gram-positive bacteria)]
MTALLFGILTVALVGPIPAALARATWPLHTPRAAMALWQSIALAAVLSAFSTGLAIAANLLAPGPDGAPTSNPVAEIERLGWFLWTVYVSVFVLTLVVGARLMYTVLRVGIRTRARRNAHRMMIDLVDNADRRLAAGRDIRILDVPTPLAYCLPGLRRRVVLSEGVLARLDDDQLTAVIAHERAHLRARHDLVLEAFIAAHEAFPRFVRSRSALGAVELLAEVLADDQAVRATTPTTLGRALVACADATAPRGAMA